MHFNSRSIFGSASCCSRVCLIVCVLLLLLLKKGALVQAQVPQNVITTKASTAWSVFAADLDSDGDKDILSASGGDLNSESKISWYENKGGGFFSEQKVITTNVDEARSVYASDLNSDSKNDVLSASRFDSKISWYKNRGGGKFSDQKIITENANDAISVHAGDLNGNGKIDIVSASDDDNKIAWYENKGGGEFSSQKIITNDAESPSSVHVEDVNSDGKLDVIFCSSDGSEVGWYKNEGSESPKFTYNYITFGSESFLDVYAADLNGDEKTDIISASFGNDRIEWYKNLGEGEFSSRKTITEDAEGATSVHATDIDGDGDLDVLSASTLDDKIAMYENKGGGSFSGQKVITTNADGASSVYAAEISGDTAIDVLSASNTDDKIAWYENGSAAPLPVELTTLTARADGKDVEIFWSTASETNNAGFYVQKSSIATDKWKRLGFVEGEGTTSETTSYRFYVQKIGPGSHQFRLRQVDTDGTEHFSETVSVRVKMQQKASLSAPAPNPVTEKARLTFAVKESKETRIILYNVLGQQVATLYEGKPASEKQIRIDLDAGELPSGTYLIRLQTGGTTKTQKVTVVR